MLVIVITIVLKYLSGRRLQVWNKGSIALRRLSHRPVSPVILPQSEYQSPVILRLFTGVYIRDRGTSFPLIVH